LPGRLVVAGLLFVLCSPLFAQITVDGTLGPAGPLTGPDYTIGPDLGSQVGENLFFSFGLFNVWTGETATFTGPGGIENIIARITGGDPSVIDGGIFTDFPGSPNLWLINPFGFVFGENATLDTQGSFAATTADYLDLVDGGRFDASNPGMSTLTSAPPAAYGFVGAPAPIIVEGATLQVPDGEELSLVGGDIFIEGAELVAISGGVNIVSVASQGEVLIDELKLDTSDFDRMGDVVIVDSTINASSSFADGAPAAGYIDIQAGNLTLESADLEASYFGLADGGGGEINIDAREQVTLSGDTELLIENHGAGDGGKIRVAAAGIRMQDGADIITREMGTGSGGGGSIVLLSDTFYMGDNSGVNAEALGAGGTGTIDIHVGEFRMTDAAAISMTNRGPGPGAKVTITADSFFMEGTGEGFPAIFANSAQQGGDAASIDITVSGAMILSNLATISASALQDSAGEAGNIFISADSLTLFAGAEIFSQSFGVGGGGNIDLTLGSELQLFASSISTQTVSADGGSITVLAPDMVYLVDSSITTSAGDGAGNGGNVTIVPPQFVILNQSQILARAVGGDGGNIDIPEPFTIISADSLISATSARGVDGEINIDGQSDLVSATTMPRARILEVEDLSESACDRQRRGDSSLKVEDGARSRMPTDPPCEL